MSSHVVFKCPFPQIPPDTVNTFQADALKRHVRTGICHGTSDMPGQFLKRLIKAGFNEGPEWKTFYLTLCGNIDS